MKALDIESGLWHWRMMTEKKLRQWVKVKITKSTGKIEMFLGKLQTLRGAERERDRDLQYSSCLLVIGTFQTGYCRVYTDRKLPARGVWKSPSVHPMCRHRSVTCPHTVPPSANYAGPGYRWWQKPFWLYFRHFYLILWARPVPGSPGTIIPPSRDPA